MINWEKITWSDDVITDKHGDVFTYRNLYNGKHVELFPRAKDLIDKGEITGNIEHGRARAQNVQTPYIIANVSKLIPEIPAMLVSRSIGKAKSSLVSTDKQNKSAAESIIDGPQGDAVNDKVQDLQQEIIEQIEKNSKLMFSHWSNIVQQQVDGGLVGVPVMDDRGLRIDFKQRDVYFDHEDERGVDLAYSRKFDDVDYLHVYRERVDEGNLYAENLLFKQGGKLEPVDDETAKELLGVDTLMNVYEGRSAPFVVYWPNEATFQDRLGNSCLKNQQSKQDEINWTLTRNAITFERNGKPRIVITQEIAQALQEKAVERYGEGTEAKLDHRDLEITTFDENGKAMEIIQIDTSKIGDFSHVKNFIKLMFIETKTSEKAVDFYMDGSSSAAQSGVAKFYDLFLSIVKAEQIQAEYVYFLQQLFENCLWLAAQDQNSGIIIEEPEIQLNSMIPISKKELIEENNLALLGGAQSLETTVRRNNPHASEEWIVEEIQRIEEESKVDNAAFPVDAQ